MQHNVHAARPAPHLRAHHHTHGHTHMQMHPSLEQHLAAAASMAGAPQMQPQQQPTPHRDHHHPRLNHHHLHAQQQQQQTPSNPAAVAVAAGPAYHHNSNISSSSSSNNNNQMQKIRQQHQHLSSSNGHVGKCQQPPPQAYNPLAGNPAALSYNPLPPPPPPHHMAAHIGGYAAHPPHYYQMSQPKPPSKYNNNNNPGGHYIANSGTSNGYGSKAILQPTYRSAKVGPVLAPAMVPEAVAASATAASSAAAAEHPECVSSSNLPGATEPAGLEELPPSDQEPSATETAATAVNEGCSTEQIDASGTLSNEDGSSGRSGKDKTPMCLVNELARYNKITHQYRLTGERGPAHCKTFTVTLKLGDEEYSADGFKIKKAQHMAASRAIEETKYKHPPPKIRRSEEASTTRTHITPTVELNALAMKLGQRTYYLLDPTQMQPTDPLLSSEYGGGSLLPTPPPGMPQPMPQPLPPPFALRPARHGHSFVPIQSPPMHPHGFYGGPQRAYGPKYASRYTMVPPLGPHMIHGPNMPYAPIPPTPSKITLYVGKQKFVGIGRTLQQAKHDAAARALQVLKTQVSSASEEALDDSMDEGDKKSPISQVHEIGIKRNMTVHFKVLREDGPAHMKNFITACVVGSIVTEGEGNGKKVSKKRSAEKMLTELQKLPPLTPTKQTPVRRIKVKTPGKNGSVNGSGTTLSLSDVVSMAKPERRKRLNVAIRPVELDDAENPITKLIQLQQTRKEKEPIFELIAKNGNEASRRREFVMEVSANGTTARGTGSSKKLAKRSAAQALLELLESDEHSRSVGVQESQDSTDGNATEIATATATSAPVIESTVDPDIPMVSTPVGPMPGILILRQHKRPPKRKVDPMIIVKDSEEAKEEEEANKETSTTTTDDNSGEPQPMETAPESTLNTSTGSNTSGVSSNSSNAAASSSAAAAVHMKEQLLYLSKLFEFEVNFSDYPKGNHNEFLTIVTLSTNPPQICHGVGKSSDESQNDAARNALKILSELGLNNAKK